jgi:hypothetical protein
MQHTPTKVKQPDIVLLNVSMTSSNVAHFYLGRKARQSRLTAAGALQVRGKAMADRSGDLLELFHDVLLTARLDDRERFRQVSTPSEPP